MSKISSKNTKPEITIRKLLFSMGYRYRLHAKGLPGKPDIILKKYNLVIFVHGCFWHLHHKCRDGTIPKTRPEYWENKLMNNRKRDKRNIRKLKNIGWRILRLWECEIEKKPNLIKGKLIKYLDG